MMNKKIINKYYDYFKNFIKDNIKGIIFLILFGIFCFYDTGYVIYKPGGTINTTSRIEGENINESKGTFNMAYVSMMEGNLPFYLLAKLNKDWELVEASKMTYNESEEVSDALIRDHLEYKAAISNATYVAFSKAGIDYEITKKHYYIAYKTEKNTSNLKIGDEILSYDDKDFTNIEELNKYINTLKENDKIKIKYQRDGKEYTTDVTIYKENNHLYIGISVCTILDIKSDFNLKVKTKSSESGPSGGLITALTIYNAITKEDITKGNKIVGTGIIDMEGNVGEIGSVEYKLAGAVKGKADIFICPKENLEAAQKYAKEKNYDIMIVGVATFDEALQTLETLKEK